MKFERRYSRAGTPVRDQVEWKRVDARIVDAGTGREVFHQPDVEVPAWWSQTATNILAQKYFRKAGVPSSLDPITNDGLQIALPKWLRRSMLAHGADLTGGETSAHQVFHRLAGCWTYWGWRSGMFRTGDKNTVPKEILSQYERYIPEKVLSQYMQSEEHARIFYDELYMMLALQVAAPNSPQWFNTGLHWAYGIQGTDSGMWICDGGEPKRIGNSYERPQSHACFLTSVADDLVNEGGIMDAWVREARIFKHGSGSGTNLSKIRAKGEPLSGGGVASGVMSWLRIADRSAGAIASGGTTRRAATMRVLDADHPEIEDFICFSGDTLVWTTLGPKRFDQLATLGSSIPVLTELDDGRLAYRDMVYPRCTRTNANLVEVTLKSRVAKTITRVRCTPDHLFFLRDGVSKKAKDLQPNDRIKSAYRYIYKGSYVELYGSTGGKIREHVITIEYKYGRGPTNDETIHHLDGNKQNNDPINLVMKSKKEHTSNHAKEWWNDPNNGDKRQLTISRSAASRSGKKRDGQALLNIQEAGRKRRGQKPTPDVIAKRVAAQTGQKRSIEARRRISEGRKRWFDGLSDEQKELIRQNASQKITEGRQKWFNNLSENQQDTERQRLRTLRSGKNHSVVSVITLDDEEPVYCGTVPDTGRFFVSLSSDHKEGILVSNCWKVREESKAAAMYVGSSLLTITSKEPLDRFVVKVPDQIADRINEGFEPEIFGIGWEGEAIETVSGQNSNNSIRVPDEFIDRLENDGTWYLTARTTGETIKAIGAKNLWDQACRAAWACADPGVIFGDTVNAWNTCAADGEITTTNPCGEFWHLCGTEHGSSACNLASLNLVKFAGDSTVPFDCDMFEHAIRMWTCVLDISVTMASYPAREFALGAHNYRTLGLGYANLGGLLARLDLRYDSDEGRSLAAAITSLMTGRAYLTSAHLAQELGAFPRFDANRKSFYNVMVKHKNAIGPAKMLTIMGGTVGEIFNRAEYRWNEVCLIPTIFRNAQITLIAPTGTIALVMDCDTTGVEPYFSRESVKNLAGGGTMEFTHNVCEEDTAMHLSPMAHVKMVAAVQPFLSGAVSKTINMPHDATVADVDDVYRAAHRLGLKAVAIYRDGSKLSQPLSTKSPSRPDETSPRSTSEPAGSERVAPSDASVGAPTFIAAIDPDSFKAAWDKLADRGILTLVEDKPRGSHEYLPWRRDRGYTQKAKVGGLTMFWRVSEYPDGRPGELFIELAHEGSTLRAAANCLAIAVSVALQHGTPLAAIVDKYLNTRFEPAGVVEGHARVKLATSFADLIARDLAITYLGREDLANVEVKMVESSILRSDWHKDEIITGGLCPDCGGLLRRTGACETCQACGWNKGCG